MTSKNQICVASSTSCNFSCNLQINSIHKTVSTNPCIVGGVTLNSNTLPVVPQVTTVTQETVF